MIQAFLEVAGAGVDKKKRLLRAGNGTFIGSREPEACEKRDRISNTGSDNWNEVKKKRTINLKGALEKSGNLLLYDILSLKETVFLQQQKFPQHFTIRS